MCAARTIVRKEFGSTKFVGEFGLKIWTKIVRNREGSKKCKFLWPGGGGFEVEDYLNSKNKVDLGRNTYIVDLEDRKCTCRYWDISGIPCRHVMTVLSLKKLRVEEYVSDWYKLSRFRASYAYEVPQMENEPYVEQPPLVEDNHPPSVDDNQPCIAKEELVNMTQEDPPMSQVVSPTPPIQQAITPITRKKERARSAHQPAKDKSEINNLGHIVHIVKSNPLLVNLGLSIAEVKSKFISSQLYDNYCEHALSQSTIPEIIILLDTQAQPLRRGQALNTNDFPPPTLNPFAPVEHAKGGDENQSHNSAPTPNQGDLVAA
ncbi:hypothetical protein SLEP1_g49449 [Rubroshorea leprosula]|uniref:SWIM-type domain-containing protein n=1 Tax=Rubroshorea leprosula TaxID=152421 RepID=A0AAV5LXT5_9ROSI|nr:hypothetical protein SLEP1_g49449 [Rubroshorea leprosula]